jgi:hypothetical protein
MNGMTIDQDKINQYYTKKKTEVRSWLENYMTYLKRINDNQRKQLLEYAKEISFDSAGKLNQYVQQLPAISKKDKKEIEKYLQSIDWLPEGVTIGFLDGKLVVKMMPNTQAEDMIREAFGPEEGDNSEK